MSKSKSKQTYKPKPFESTGGHFTNPTTGKFQADTSANIYESMLLHPAFQGLSHDQRLLYFVCKAQYYGKRKPTKDYTELDQDDVEYFYLNWALVQQYGIYKPSMRSNFHKDMKALCEAGFIEIRISGKYHRTKTVYHFSDKWWTSTLP